MHLEFWKGGAVVTAGGTKKLVHATPELAGVEHDVEALLDTLDHGVVEVRRRDPR